MEILINSNNTEKEIYEEIAEQLKYLIIPTDKILSNLSNFTAMLKQAFSKISWVGFYIRKNDKLFLGPFQGNTACTEISIGRGVCGTSAAKKQTVIVDDVTHFSGHIACDSNSQSEIVIPIIIKNNIWGVLDIDSYEKSAFSNLDRNYLEKFCNFLTENLEMSNFILE